MREVSMSNGIEPIQNKFLKFVWLLTAKDWTNELIIIGVLLVAIWHKDTELSSMIVGGLIGYLTRVAQDGLDKVGDKL